MKKDPNKIKFTMAWINGEASGWGIVGMVIIVLIVCLV